MNQKINIPALIDAVAARQGISKRNAEVFVREFFTLVEEGLMRDSYLKIKGLGTFKLIGVEKRQSVNIQTGESIHIEGHSKISFTPENALKELINQPFANFETVIIDDESELVATAEEQGVEEPIIEKPEVEDTAVEEVVITPAAKEDIPAKVALLQPQKTETDHSKWMYVGGVCLLVILLIFILIWIL